MDNREFLRREVEVLREIPRDEVGDFIEANGERLRSILNEHEEYSNREIMEMLQSGYRGI